MDGTVVCPECGSSMATQDSKGRIFCKDCGQRFILVPEDVLSTLPKFSFKPRLSLKTLRSLA